MSSAPPPPSPATQRPESDGDGGPGRDPQDPRVLSGAAGTALIALLAVGAAMFLTTGPLWMTLAGLVAALFGMALAVVALTRLRRAPRKGTVILTSIIALVIGLWSLVGGGARLVFWEQWSAYDTCMSTSVTISGTASCQQELEDGLRGAILPGPASDDGPGSEPSTAPADTAGSSDPADDTGSSAPAAPTGGGQVSDEPSASA